MQEVNSTQRIDDLISKYLVDIKKCQSIKYQIIQLNLDHLLRDVSLLMLTSISLKRVALIIDELESEFKRNYNSSFFEGGHYDCYQSSLRMCINVILFVAVMNDYERIKKLDFHNSSVVYAVIRDNFSYFYEYFGNFIDNCTAFLGDKPCFSSVLLESDDFYFKKHIYDSLNALVTAYDLNALFLGMSLEPGDKGYHHFVVFTHLIEESVQRHQRIDSCLGISCDVENYIKKLFTIFC